MALFLLDVQTHSEQAVVNVLTGSDVSYAELSLYWLRTCLLSPLDCCLRFDHHPGCQWGSWFHMDTHLQNVALPKFVALLEFHWHAVPVDISFVHCLYDQRCNLLVFSVVLL